MVANLPQVARLDLPFLQQLLGFINLNLSILRLVLELKAAELQFLFGKAPVEQIRQLKFICKDVKIKRAARFVRDDVCTFAFLRRPAYLTVLESLTFVFKV